MDGDCSNRIDDISRGGWCLAVMMVVATALPTALFAARPIDLHRAAGLFPPWWSQRTVLEAASGAGMLVAQGTLPFIAIVQTPEADVGQRLRKAGALIVIDARFAAFCSGGKI